MIAPQNSNDTGVVFESANGEQTVKKTIAFSMGKVRKWLALGIGITGVLAIALSDLFVYLLGSGRLSADAFSTIAVVARIVSVIVMLPARIIVGIKSFSNKSGLRIGGYVTYATARGVLLSFVFRDVMVRSESPYTYIWLLSLSFLITAARFLAFGLIADHVSKKIPFLFAIRGAGFVSLLVLSLLNVFLQVNALYWGIEIGTLLLRLLVVAIDRANVKKIAESKVFSSAKNRSIYCAYQLYVDFIWLFLRVLLILASSSGKKK